MCQPLTPTDDCCQHGTCPTTSTLGPTPRQHCSPSPPKPPSHNHYCLHKKTTSHTVKLTKCLVLVCLSSMKRGNPPRRCRQQTLFDTAPCWGLQNHTQQHRLLVRAVDWITPPWHIMQHPARQMAGEGSKYVKLSSWLGACCICCHDFVHGAPEVPHSLRMWPFAAVNSARQHGQAASLFLASHLLDIVLCPRSRITASLQPHAWWLFHWHHMDLHSVYDEVQRRPGFLYECAIFVLTKLVPGIVAMAPSA